MISSIGFRDLQNYTTLKLMMYNQYHFCCFRDLQNYTTLKRTEDMSMQNNCFRDLQNYTTLKLVGASKND